MLLIIIRLILICKLIFSDNQMISVITTFTVQTENKEWFLKPVGGLETARMNIFGSIEAVSGKRSGIFEDSVVTNATSARTCRSAKTANQFIKRHMALVPGMTYKVDVVVRDVVSGNKGIVSKGFTVPKYNNKELSILRH